MLTCDLFAAAGLLVQHPINTTCRITDTLNRIRPKIIEDDQPKLKIIRAM